MGVEVQTISPGDGKFMRLFGFGCGGGGGNGAGEFPRNAVETLSKFTQKIKFILTDEDLVVIYPFGQFATIVKSRSCSHT